MKAIVTRRFGNPPQMGVEERPKPVPREGCTLVRLRAATINQLSNTVRTGEFGFPKAPLVLGNEGAGTVEESGRFPAGTRVAVYGHSDLGVTVDGLFQEWALVRDDRLLQLPDTLDWAEGSALTVNYLTAYLALTKAAGVRNGQTALVSGATGGVGHAVMQTARALGARPIALVSTARKARRAAEAGAPAVIDSSSRHLGEAVAELTDGRGVDIALDPVGGPRLGELIRSVRRHGTIVSLGFTGGRQATVEIMDLLAGERVVTGYGVHGDSDEEIAKGLDGIGRLAAEGHLRPVIDSRYALSDFEAGYARLASRKAVGSIALEL
ncbi:zinc-binding alcohol dehydrogenase family protein [Streptomyces sp. NPDC050546]|uniref:zinc-binding alcohol dehydrogenase family protein n=1 Tax=Streptomyces sp. NPDC050546 TaxID=3365628 RepID=UPI00379F2B37